MLIKELIEILQEMNQEVVTMISRENKGGPGRTEDIQVKEGFWDGFDCVIISGGE